MNDSQVSTSDPIEVYRDEHRLIRDSVLDIVDAGRQGDVDRALELVERFDEEIGPHYRYEEEALYPKMTRFLGEERAEELIDLQEESIAAVREMKAILGDGTITHEEDGRLDESMYSLMGHIYDCDVAILMETLTAEELDDVSEAIERSYEEAVPLVEWAETMR